MIAALTDPQVVRTFVIDYGWGWNAWHDWAVDALAQLALAGEESRQAQGP